MRAGDADEWAETASEQDIAQLVEDQAVNEGQFDPERVEQELEQAADIDARRWAYLVGLDRAFALVHPEIDSPERGALTEMAVRYRSEHRLNTTNEDGALLPRVATPPRLLTMDDPPVEDKADLFCNVTRIPPEYWTRVRPVRLPRESDVLPDVAAALTVGCAPMASARDVTISPDVSGRRPYYRVEITESEQMKARIEPVLRALDGSMASIAVLPELVLNAEVLGRWQEVLRTQPPPQGGRLRVLVVGSGVLEEPNADGCSPNRAVVLSRTGDLLWTQDKRHGFTLTAATIESWGLRDPLGAHTLAEPIIPDSHITVVESTAGRIVALICEDLDRLMEDGPILRAIGPSLALSPVLSSPTLPWHWEHQDARKLVSEVGTHTVISNSLIVEDLMRDGGKLDEPELGTALAQAPSGHFDSGHCADPADVVLLRLTADDVVRAELVTRNG